MHMRERDPRPGAAAEVPVDPGMPVEVVPGLDGGFDDEGLGALEWLRCWGRLPCRDR